MLIEDFDFLFSFLILKKTVTNHSKQDLLTSNYNLTKKWNDSTSSYQCMKDAHLFPSMQKRKAPKDNAPTASIA